MTHDELARRRPVWEAMSDFFLDTETRWAVPWVARRCAESGYDDETLERIFWGEVFPEAIGNLEQVAGEWGLLELDEQALINRANHPGIPWLKRRAAGWMVEHTWLAARAVTPWLRGLPPEELDRRYHALRMLGHRFFDEPEKPCALATPEHAAPLLDVMREEWRRYEPLCRAMAKDDKSPSPDACAAAVRSLLGPG